MSADRTLDMPQMSGRCIWQKGECLFCPVFVWGIHLLPAWERYL